MMQHFINRAVSLPNTEGTIRSASENAFRFLVKDNVLNRVLMAFQSGFQLLQGLIIDLSFSTGKSHSHNSA